MLYQRGRHLSTKTFRTRAEQRVRNRQAKRELVEQGRAHGILVYANKEPVGWCQYGSVDELPLPGPGRQASRVRAHDPTSRWRITCFVTHQHHRGKGVASIALAAAIEAIRRQGGGWVEGCPIALASPFVDRRLRELLRTHGRDSAQVEAYLEGRGWPEVVVRGVGPVRAVRGSFGSVAHAGTLSMFEQQGFEAVRVVRGTNVLMRLRV